MLGPTTGGGSAEVVEGGGRVVVGGGAAVEVVIGSVGGGSRVIEVVDALTTSCGVHAESSMPSAASPAMKLSQDWRLPIWCLFHAVVAPGNPT